MCLLRWSLQVDQPGSQSAYICFNNWQVWFFPHLRWKPDCKLSLTMNSRVELVSSRWFAFRAGLKIFSCWFLGVWTSTSFSHECHEAKLAFKYACGHRNIPWERTHHYRCRTRQFLIWLTFQNSLRQDSLNIGMNEKLEGSLTKGSIPRLFTYRMSDTSTTSNEPKYIFPSKMLDPGSQEFIRLNIDRQIASPGLYPYFSE